MKDFLANLDPLSGAIIFSLLGILILMLAFWLYDKLTPFKLWDEIVQKQNVALAIVVAAVVLGLSIIIASAHG